MLWAAVSYSIGIVAGFYLWRPMLWWIIAAVGFVAAAAYFARRRAGLGWLLALGALFLAGALHIQLRTGSPDRNPDQTPVPPIQTYADREPLEIVAHVTRDGRTQPGGFGETRQTLDVESEQISTAAGEIIPVHSGIRLSLYSRSDDAATQPSPFHYGDRLRFVARLRLPRYFRNPGAFDYQGYLADRGIAALGSAKLESVERLPGFFGSRIAFWRSRLHRAIVAKIHELWPARDAALLEAMVIAKKPSSTATPAPTSSAPVLTTFWSSPE